MLMGIEFGFSFVRKDKTGDAAFIFCKNIM